MSDCDDCKWMHEGSASEHGYIDCTSPEKCEEGERILEEVFGA